MTQDEPKVIASSRYDTKTTSELLGINRKTLVQYTESGLIKCGFRRTNGRRFWTGAEILRLWRAML